MVFSPLKTPQYIEKVTIGHGTPTQSKTERHSTATINITGKLLWVRVRVVWKLFIAVRPFKITNMRRKTYRATYHNCGT